MKKFVLLLIMALSAKFVFAVDAAYFKNNAGVDFLYVDSPEGLRIRDTPSLSGNRIGVLFDRMKVACHSERELYKKQHEELNQDGRVH